MAERPWQDKSKMEELYYDEKMNGREMAEFWDCSTSVIYKWMDRHDLERRDLGEIRRLSDEYGSQSAGYRTQANGYTEVYADYDKDRDSLYVHRLLAIAKYGIEAVKDEHVHHKNHIPFDNREDNIELTDPSSHQTHHLNIRHKNKEMPGVE